MAKKEGKSESGGIKIKKELHLIEEQILVQNFQWL
jgi:hypothetical protein